jgi:putative transposase
VLNELRSRGVNDVLIVCSDGLKGLDKAVEAVFAEATHINCVVHLVRNALAQVGAQYKKAVAGDLKSIYQAPTYEAAELAVEDLQKNWGDRYPILVRQWIEILPALAVLWEFSPALRSMVYTTNPLENINRQMRKVTKNRALLPSIESALRLFTLVLMNIDRRAQHRARHDWKAIVTELHIHFEGRLPDDWGRRLV